LLPPAHEAIIVLPTQKERGSASQPLTQQHSKMNYLKIPFDVEDFGISLARGVSFELLRGCSRGAVSLSDADESEPNKFNASFGAWVVPLQPAEVQNVFKPPPSAPTAEVLTTYFLLGFKALARASC
jgi:hypothetical protein